MNSDYCKLIRDLLPSYADGSLDRGRKELIDSHLSECPECRKNHIKRCPDTNLKTSPAFRSHSKQNPPSTNHQKLLINSIFITIVILLLVVASFPTGGYPPGKLLRVTSAEDFAQKAVPGWQRAQGSGQIVDLNITKAFDSRIISKQGDRCTVRANSTPVPLFAPVWAVLPSSGLT